MLLKVCSRCVFVFSPFYQISIYLGRIAGQSVKASLSSAAAVHSRLNRRNTAKQSQNKKRNALVSATRIFNGVDGTPRIIAVIPLTEDVSPRSTIASLAESLDLSAEGCSEDGIWRMKYVLLFSKDNINSSLSG